jgi:general secretion pathway protein H
MLVVLAILGLCVGIAGPSLRDSSGNRSLDNSVRQISGLLRATRSEAVLSGADAVVEIDLEAMQVSASWTAQKIEIPLKVAIDVLTAHEELLVVAKPSFRFFPDGSATGGTIRLRTPETTLAIRIDWLTGRIARDRAHQ